TTMAVIVRNKEKKVIFEFSGQISGSSSRGVFPPLPYSILFVVHTFLSHLELS
ncbi:FAT1 isoform 12, partial [Pan troglodytes]